MILFLQPTPVASRSTLITHYVNILQYIQHSTGFYGGRKQENPEKTFVAYEIQHIKQTQFTFGVRGARTSDLYLWNHSGERQRVSSIRHPCYPSVSKGFKN
jgi:hypothetical protein